MTLVGWWPLTETSGDAQDYSGNAIDGTLNAVTQGIPGVLGYNSYSFSGGSSTVDFGSSAIIGSTTSLSISIWVYPDNLSSSYGIFTFGTDDNFDSWIQYRTEIPGIRYGLSNTDSTREFIDVNADISSDMWTHIAATWDGQTTRVYINGIQSSTTGSLSGTVDESSSQKVLGSKPDGQNNWEGEMFDLRLYNRALTSQEISYIYQAAQSGSVRFSSKTSP